jgi:5-methylcytosine-specific restriction endonuclease McrA
VKIEVPYWERYDTRMKLKRAKRSYGGEQRVLLRQGRLFQRNKRLGKILKFTSINKIKTPFELMYKVCQEFKSRFFNKPTEEKIQQMKLLSKFVIANGTPYKYRRSKTREGYILDKDCWACKTEKAVEQHHLITIINGGYDNGINRISLCKNCHDRIHPWMGMRKRTRDYAEEYRRIVEQVNT